MDYRASLVQGMDISLVKRSPKLFFGQVPVGAKEELDQLLQGRLDRFRRVMQQKGLGKYREALGEDLQVAPTGQGDELQSQKRRLLYVQGVLKREHRLLQDVSKAVMQIPIDGFVQAEEASQKPGQSGVV